MSSGARATSARLARHADVSQVFCAALAERAWRISGGCRAVRVAVTFWLASRVAAFAATARKHAPTAHLRKRDAALDESISPARRAGSITAIGNASTELAGAAA